MELTKFSFMVDYINGFGIVESYSDSNIIANYKYYNNDYLLDVDSTYITSIDKPIIKNAGKKYSLCFILNDNSNFFNSEFAIENGFYFIEQINNNLDYRLYFFSVDCSDIFEKIINNLELVEKFHNYFKTENKDVLDIFDRIRNDFDSSRIKYFQKPNEFSLYSGKQKLSTILELMNIKNSALDLTREEWNFINLYSHGKNYNIDISNIYNTSRVEIEERFNSIKCKLLK